MFSFEMNPILLREIRDLRRTEAKTDAWSLGYFVACALFVGAVYTADAMGWFHVRIPVIAFHVLAGFEAIFAIRAYNAGTVVGRERDQNTFHSLFLTPLSPARFWAGEILFNLWITVQRIALMLPFFGAVYLLGGFTLSRFLVYQCVILVFGLQSYAVTMAMSLTVFSSEAIAARMKKMGARIVVLGRQQFEPSHAIGFIAFFIAMSLLNQSLPGILSQVFTGNQPLGATLPNPVRALAALHPLFVLFCWGRVEFFGFGIPLWAFSMVLWLLIAHASYHSFVYNLTLRKFRYNRGYRFGRWLLFLGIHILIAGVCRDSPALGLRLSVGLLLMYIMVRLLKPGVVPVTPQDRWQLFPRGDLFVNRAGNMFPHFVLVAAGAWAVQSAMSVFPGLAPGHARMALLLNAEFFLIAAAIILGGQALAMRREIREMNEDHVPAPPPADGQSAEAAKPAPSAAGSALVRWAIAAWLLPVAPVILEPALRATPVHDIAKALVRILQPLLYANPFWFGFRLVSRNANRMTANLPLDCSGKPLVTVGGVSLDEYRVSLMVAGFLAVAAMLAFRVMARKYARASAARDASEAAA